MMVTSSPTRHAKNGSRHLLQLVLVVSQSISIIEAFQATTTTRGSAAAARAAVKSRSACLRSSSRLHVATPATQQEEATAATGTNDESNGNLNSYSYVSPQYWEIGATMLHPQPPKLTEEIRQALETNTHLPNETQDTLGKGLYITADWRGAYQSYGRAVGDVPNVVDVNDGYASYDIERIDGSLPDDLVGTLYRNGPGKFGLGNDRVLHPLDADGVITKLTFPEPSTTGGETPPRTVTFRSKFVETKQFQQELQADKFLFRGTFGTGPYVPSLDQLNPLRQKQQQESTNNIKNMGNALASTGINEDPIKPTLVSRLPKQCMNVDLKNPANTQIISFGGKVLALFEAGLPYSIDPETLDTIGEDTLNGMLSPGLPVKLPDSDMENIPDGMLPDFLGGTAHTAHPKMCSYTGNLVGWYWSSISDGKSTRELTFMEWSPDTDLTADTSSSSSSISSPIAKKEYGIENCGLAPHDMSLTQNCVMLVFNAMAMNDLPFLLGIKGAAESLQLAGRDPTYAWIAPRPTSKTQFEPFKVELPAWFSIHCSHAYEDEITGNIVAYYTGWPPSDESTFLGAWGGFAPDFGIVPVSYLWRIEIDPKARKCVSFDVAPGSANACVEHAVVHPNFSGKKCEHVYACAGNVVGDCSAPNGVVRLNVESGSTRKLQPGEFNHEIDAYWYGTRTCTDEPLVAPKHGGNINNEKEAYLLQMVKDAVEDKSYLAVFDLERELRKGPVCKVWLKNAVPHGLHGCFAPNGGGRPSYFC